MRALAMALVVAAAIGVGGASANGEPTSDLTPQWSPDGRTIAFVRVWANANEVTNIRLELLGVADGSLTDSGVELLGVGATDYAWSPDSARLAVGQSGLTVVDLHSGHRTALVRNGGSCCIQSVDWSPDGERVAYADPARGVVVQAADGGASWVVDADGHAVTWSPDGSEVAVGVADGVLIYDVASHAARRAVSTSSTVFDVDWSSRGELAVADRNGNVFVRRDGTAERVGLGFGLSWSPSGRRLAWADSGVVRLWNPVGGQIRTVNAGDGYPGQPSWSPDGRRLAFVGTDICPAGIFVADAETLRSQRLTRRCRVFGNPSLRTANLRITVWPHGSLKPPTHWRLRCGPPSGTVPRPAAACAQLLSFAQPWLTDRPPCHEAITGPQLARVRGTLRGRHVWTTFRRRTTCEAGHWDALALLFPGVRHS